MMVTASLLITTYNRPDAIELCLQSILRQSVLPLEVVVCDDGSTGETKELIEEYQKKFTVPLIHVWQPDEGFKLAQIRNKGIAKARGNYIIQADGDLILHRHFIKDGGTETEASGHTDHRFRADSQSGPDGGEVARHVQCPPERHLPHELHVVVLRGPRFAGDLIE